LLLVFFVCFLFFLFVFFMVFFFVGFCYLCIFVAAGIKEKEMKKTDSGES